MTDIKKWYVLVERYKASGRPLRIIVEELTCQEAEECRIGWDDVRGPFDSQEEADGETVDLWKSHYGDENLNEIQDTGKG